MLWNSIIADVSDNVDNVHLCPTEKYIILKVVPSCLAGALEIILLCGIFFIYQSRKGRLTEHQGKYVLPIHFYKL